ncbi:hypothetical protein OIU78_006399 [Salix suchowensis]|nr:hypothetical protein OIU78_006399 [Salix suchowensis]
MTFLLLMLILLLGWVLFPLGSLIFCFGCITRGSHYLDVLKKDTGGYKGVVAAFGDDILQANGEVDRPKLGQIVFSDPGKRQLLNRLLAPYISSGIWWEILRLWLKGYKVIVLDIPLLFEAKMDKWTKPIVVVWVDTETQLEFFAVQVLLR